MCARYSLANADPILAELLEGVDWESLPPRLNVAPGTDVPTVDASEGGIRLRMRRWGLVPRWAADRPPASTLINARSETIGEKPSFRASYRDRRCALPADGWFEWREAGRIKQPYFAYRRDGGGLWFAGLWDRAPTPDGPRETCAIATTAPCPEIAPLHDRMPALLTRDEAAAWVDPSTPPDVLLGLLRPWPHGGLGYHAVDRRMGNPRHQDAGILAAVPDPFADGATLEIGGQRSLDFS